MSLCLRTVLCPLIVVAFSGFFAPAVSASAEANGQCVVLLHGLARSSNAMIDMEEFLAGQGFKVVNYSYPSTDFPVEELAVVHVSQAVAQCSTKEPVHFVTHSMGGILLRYWAFADNQAVAKIGRAVMLAPPNQGSELVDKLGDVPGFELLNGPAGKQLGTDPDSIPRNLPAVQFELGVIAGDASLNPVYSGMLPGQDDGKVTVESTKVSGMTDFIVMPHTHTFIMNIDDVQEEVLHFLLHGRFENGLLATQSDMPSAT